MEALRLCFSVLTLCYLDRTQEIMAKPACLAFSRSCVSPVLIAPEYAASFKTHLHGTQLWREKFSNLCHCFCIAVGPHTLFTCWLKPNCRAGEQISSFHTFLISSDAMEVVMWGGEHITPYRIEVYKITKFSHVTWGKIVKKTFLQLAEKLYVLA